jgi:hypothetical protein
LFTSTTQRSGPNANILTGRKQFKRIELYYKQKYERKNVQGNKRTKMEKQPNKRNKQKKTYREIAIEKQANIGKNEKNNQRKNRESKLCG